MPCRLGNGLPKSESCLDEADGSPTLVTVNALNAHNVSSEGAHGCVRTVDSDLDLRTPKALSEAECPEKLILRVRKLLKQYSHVLADTDESTGLC
jgi:hypothetical protein